MDALWRNPELIRHFRADLRPSRMAVGATVSILLCVLILLIFYHPGSAQSDSPEIRLTLYAILISIQALVLCLWCLSSCSQAIASERILKTFDFLRTTRLTAWELMLGKAFGAPLMAYFVVACTLPFTLIIGLAAGISIGAIALTYLMLLMVAVVLSLAALTISMMTDKPRAGEVVLLLLIIGWPAAAFSITAGGETRFPGFSAIAVVLGLLRFYPHAASSSNEVNRYAHVPFFGVQVPSLFVSIVLYVSAGAWLILMLVRNLKKDREDIRLLSRWQAIAFTAYVNVLVFALLDLRPMYSASTYHIEPISASDVALGYLALNFLILYAVGFATLTPPARLKSWWRRSAQDFSFYWSDDGPPWPWMAASAVAAFLLFVLEASVSTRFIPFSQWSVPALAGHLFVLLVFAVRDILFLQWCAVKGFQRPVLKGTLFLALYYFTAFIIAGFFLHKSLAWFTPVGAFGDSEIASPIATLVGVILQIAASIFLLRAIHQRLRPPALATAVTAAVPGS
jgi:hypothetical protein